MKHPRAGHEHDVKRHVLTWLAGWLAFFWLWQLLVGQWNATEWVAGGVAATLAATVGEVARSAAGERLGTPGRVLGALGPALLQVVADFGILMWALPRRRRGRMVTRSAEMHGVWAAYIATLSPNAYVIDRGGTEVTLHDLVPVRQSERPV